MNRHGGAALSKIAVAEVPKALRVSTVSTVSSGTYAGTVIDRPAPEALRTQTSRTTTAAW